MITININKAKAIAHDIRRAARTEEFKPLDVQATIPSQAIAAETAREAIRVKYAQMQEAIDSAVAINEIKAVMPQRS